MLCDGIIKEEYLGDLFFFFFFRKKEEEMIGSDYLSAHKHSANFARPGNSHTRDCGQKAATPLVTSSNIRLRFYGSVRNSETMMMRNIPFLVFYEAGNFEHFWKFCFERSFLLCDRLKRFKLIDKIMLKLFN